MARIKISVPDKFNFTCTIPVRITDLNYGGHLGNDSLLTILHEARMQFLRHSGNSEKDFAGTGLIMADAAIQFKSEVFYGDKLIISVAATDFHRIGFDLIYKVDKNLDGKIIPVAYAKTGMICFDYVTKKVTAVPQAAIDQLI